MAEAATSFSSGMSAISNTLFTLLSPGDRVVSIKDTYGGTNKLFIEFLPRFGIEVSLCNTNDYKAIESAIAEGCKAVYLESPTNPTVKIVDLARLAASVAERGSSPAECGIRNSDSGQTSAGKWRRRYPRVIGPQRTHPLCAPEHRAFRNARQPDQLGSWHSRESRFPQASH
jgi:hypothetical protein